MNNEFNNQDMNQFQNNNMNSGYANSQNNKNDKWKDTLILILVIIVFILTALSLYFVIGMKNNNLDGNKDNNQQENVSDENNYNIFSGNLKKEISRYTEYTYQYEFVSNDILGLELNYSVSLEEDGNLYVEYANNDELKQKYGKYKIAEKVLSFYVISYGQNGGNRVYFINQNGTVGYAETENNIGETSEIDVKNDLGFSKIVAVVPAVFSPGRGGYRGVIFIDINGKIH